MSGILVTDFDGTMARRDFYDVALEDLLPPGTESLWDDYKGGRITHFQAIQTMFAQLPDDEARLEAAARRMEFDPAAADAIRNLRRAGWDVVIASAGCDWYIRRLLKWHQIMVLDTPDMSLSPDIPAVTLYANPGELVPGGGIRVDAPRKSRYYSESLGIDKEGILRRALALAPRVAFAGDGRPDLTPALAVSSPYRFARGWLATELKSLNFDYTPFDWWSEVAAELLG